MANNTDQWVSDILQQYSTKRFFIEYNGFMSNHMAHGIVALKDLGASQTKIGQFADWCGQLLEPPDHPNHAGEDPDAEPVSDQELQQLLGKRKSYYGIRNNYINKLKDVGSLEDLIKAEFPKLMRGLGCVAFHGLIQIGYGFRAEHGTVVCEGLAYLHHSYHAFTFSEAKAVNDISNFGHGDEEILEVLYELRGDSSLRHKMLEDGLVIEKSGRFLGGGFSSRFAALTENHGDVILKYANRIKIPQKKDGENEAEFLINLSDWLIDQAIAVYALSKRPNDFFLLHGVTSAWSLGQIIPCLNPDDAMDALRIFTCDLMAAYLVVDAPPLTEPSTTMVHTVSDKTWREIIDRLLALELDPHEEHLYKLVHVCHSQWTKDKASPKAGLYVDAAKLCMDHKMTFCSYSEELTLE